LPDFALHVAQAHLLHQCHLLENEELPIDHHKLSRSVFVIHNLQEARLGQDYHRCVRDCVQGLLVAYFSKFERIFFN
jgi:hypothetical protein